MSAQAQPKMDSLQYFTLLLKKHHREMLVYARSLTQNEHHAKDIAQDAFVSAWEHLDVFDVTKDFPAWMRGIIRNKWREWLRKTKRETAMDDETLEYFEATLRDWESKGLGGGPALFQKLESCLSQLPEGMAAAVTAYYRDGYSTGEAADVVGCQPGTLRKRLERARQSLKNCIENE